MVVSVDITCTPNTLVGIFPLGQSTSVYQIRGVTHTWKWKLV